MTHAVVFVGLLIIFPQRMPLPIFGQQNSRHVRVPVELDSDEVIRFALEPIGRGPHVAHRGDFRIVLVELDLQNRRVPLLVRKKVIHNFDPIDPIHARNKAEEIKLQLAIFAKMRGHLVKSIRSNLDPRLTVLGLTEGLDRIAEFSAKVGMDLLQVHAKTGSPWELPFFNN